MTYQYENDEERQHFEYLDGLRESGVTNMFGAGAYLQEVFGLDSLPAKTILLKWMSTFGERHAD